MGETGMGDTSGWLRRTGRRLRAVPATAGLSLACVVVFVATLGICAARTQDLSFLLQAGWRLDTCHDTLVDLGALSVAHVWLDGSWWRLASAGLLHGSLLHIVLNIWSLVVVGEWAERAWGSRRLLALFGLSSLGGCLASQAWAEAPMIVGASAGIMGIAGALWVARVFSVQPEAKVLRPLSARGLAFAIGILVGLGFAVPVIAQAGHLGGLAVGVAIGWSWTGRRGAWLGWAAVAGMASAWALGAATPHWRRAHSEYLGFELMARGRHAEGAEELERVLSTRPGEAPLQNAVAYAYAVAGIELDRAEALVRAALAEDPEQPDYQDTLGWIYCRRGKPEEGIGWLKKASDGTEGGVEEIEGHLRDCATVSVESP